MAGFWAVRKTAAGAIATSCCLAYQLQPSRGETSVPRITWQQGHHFQRHWCQSSTLVKPGTSHFERRHSRHFGATKFTQSRKVPLDEPGDPTKSQRCHPLLSIGMARY